MPKKVAKGASASANSSRRGARTGAGASGEPPASASAPILGCARPRHQSPPQVAATPTPIAAETPIAGRQPASEPIAPPSAGPAICPDIRAVT